MGHSSQNHQYLFFSVCSQVSALANLSGRERDNPPKGWVSTFPSNLQSVTNLYLPLPCQHRACSLLCALMFSLLSHLPRNPVTLDTVKNLLPLLGTRTDNAENHFEENETWHLQVRHTGYMKDHTQIGMFLTVWLP